MVFTFFFHISLAFSLLNTFHTDTFGGALFIMHFCPHSGCFAHFHACAVICSPVSDNSLTSLQPDCCRSGGLERFFPILFPYFFPPYESQKRCFEKAMNKPAHAKLLLWHGRAFRPAGSRAGLGCAAAGAGSALRAAGTVGRAAVLWGGRGLLDLLRASRLRLTCCQHRAGERRKNRQETLIKWCAKKGWQAVEEKLWNGVSKVENRVFLILHYIQCSHPWVIEKCV